jgi:sulfate transport system permease protein
VLTRGVAMLWLSVIVLIPVAAVVLRSMDGGLSAFWDAISAPEAQAAIKLTFISSLIVVAINVVMGTMIAWVLVRDEFPGKRYVNSIIDLPFALPTIVAGLVLLSKGAVVLALLFVTLPFVVRAVQPVLLELDRDMEEAAASLGASNTRIFRSIVLPNLTPAILAGAALAFARAIGEFGSLVLLTGNVPFKTQVASVYIFGRIEGNNTTAAAAVSVLLLVLSVAMLFAFQLFSYWRTRHDRG